MSMNSLHQNDPEMVGGAQAAEWQHAEVLATALGQYFTATTNYRNAGNTAFDEVTVQIGYMRGGGVASIAGGIIGYRGPRPTQSNAVKHRIIRMGPYKLRKMHLSMKANNMQRALGNEARHPLYYTIERLLQLFFDDYVADVIPQRIRNWEPTEGTLWHHWWKER